MTDHPRIRNAMPVPMATAGHWWQDAAMNPRVKSPDIPVGAFSEEQAARLTGLSRGQLRAWDKRGFFRPDLGYEDRRSSYARIYSYRNLVGLRTIARLMRDYGISLRQLGTVATELTRRGHERWAELNLFVLNGQVHFLPPGQDVPEGVQDGQLAMLSMVDVFDEVAEGVRRLRSRSDSQLGKIEQRKHVVRNAPVLAGTRILTAAIRRFHEAGYSVAEILEQYPSLTPRDVEAALAFEQGLARSA